MSSDAPGCPMSSLSLNSADSQPEDDWDHSLVVGGAISRASPVDELADSRTLTTISHLSRMTPRSSIVFPVDGSPGRATHYNSGHSRSGSLEGLDIGNKKRTLSDLLRLHSEKGSNRSYTVEEAKRIADVLGQWINASSSPYESDDDFFMRHAQDDISLNASGSFRRMPAVPPDHGGRPRGKSETANTNADRSRPPSLLGNTTS